jgi:pimeloyl-ACP methyl ester carboxylesterase
MTEHDTTGEPVSRYFTSQGLRLHYADWGNADAPPLLLLHGTRDHARSWDWTARRLRDRWHVMALDWRGHGDSAWSPDGAYLLPYNILDLLEMIEALGVPQVTIVAHSFGGNVAARYAGVYPDRVRKIVFVDSLGPATDTYVKWDEMGPVNRTLEWLEQRRDKRQTEPRRLASIEDAAARMAKANPRLTAEQAYHLAKYGLNRFEDGYGWKFDPRVSMFAPEDWEVRGGAYWREITAPSLIMYGRQSWHSDPVTDGRAAFFKNAQVLNFETAGHWIHHDALDAFLAALDAFL